MPSCLDVGKLQEGLTQPPHPFHPTPPFPGIPYRCLAEYSDIDESCAHESDFQPLIICEKDGNSSICFIN